MNEDKSSSDSASLSSESKSDGVSSTTQTSNKTGDHSHSSGSSTSLARAETRAVKRSKRIVLAVILLAATAIGTATYIFMRNEETYQFETQFDDYAHEIVDLANEEAKSLFATVESMSTAVTSTSIVSNMTFPFLTVPHFEIRGEESLFLSGALQYTYAPLVQTSQVKEWEKYVGDHKGWLVESLAWEKEVREALAQPGETSVTDDAWHLVSDRRALDSIPEVKDYIWKNNSDGEPVPQLGGGETVGLEHYMPVWQQSPAPTDGAIINFDLLSILAFQHAYEELYLSRLPVLSRTIDLGWLFDTAVQDKEEHPHSFLMIPVHSRFKAGLHDRDHLKAVFVAVMPWDVYFTGLLSSGVDGIVVVLEDTCGGAFTYQINGPEAVYIGAGDLHEHNYDSMEARDDFASFLKHNYTLANRDICSYDIRLYPSAIMEDHYRTHKPAIYAFVVVMVFVCTAMSFLMYDYLVQVRQDKVMSTAKRTNAIVSSLFPDNVRDRILKDAEEQARAELDGKGSGKGAPKAQLKVFMKEEESDETRAYSTKPIADLFPATTVLFADIVGFTAWSSVREPCQVFELLETLYHAFDVVAKQRRVFKVETIGDCYVAVTGLPDPRKDHAVVMARFSRDCLAKMNDLVKKLEVSLGPDTGELSMRFGLHSGPVTAGVLRGDKSRFQLFGDTVNTAARIESTGERNKIHISKECADHLIDAGKGHWVDERTDMVEAKGKGELQTYWLAIKRSSAAKSTTSGSGDGDAQSQVTDEAEPEANQKDVQDANSPVVIRKSVEEEKHERLVDWNVDVLVRLLKQVVARRQASRRSHCEDEHSPAMTNEERSVGATVLDEVVEIVHLPEYDAVAAKKQVSADSIDLDPEVIREMREFVSTIASLYRDNPFHNFEHASHVTMSVVKLLGRIVAPDIETTDKDSTLQYHDHTYGITSDPLTQFAVVFSALIHDVDHFGVPNAQLVLEEAHIAAVYKNKSVAEQNSIDIAWDLLSDGCFSKLRSTIYSNSEEQRRFRQLVVNTVLATDIMDKELKLLRNTRWDKAFKEVSTDENPMDSVNRKATIVIEHLIQASDIAHTMQHWHIYRKWNERFFEECYKAFKEGRTEKDPSEQWYNGEIGFFDFYIIPLAKKLKNCGVFGVSSDEYLAYAEKNRREWEAKGEDVVASMVEKFRTQYGVDEAQPLSPRIKTTTPTLPKKSRPLNVMGSFPPLITTAMAQGKPTSQLEPSARNAQKFVFM